MTDANPHNAMVRTGLFSFGVALVVAAPVVGLVPGPGGVVVFAAGLALMLRNSRWAKRQFVGAKRRWPRAGDLADRGLRRASSARRRSRAEQDALR